ncbi:MAG: hypothetical protein WBC33_07850, partial [Conexibacter sp.]
MSIDRVLRARGLRDHLIASSLLDAGDMAIDLSPTIESLLSGALRDWPDLRCCATRPDTGSVCGAPATHQRTPIASAATAWPYCASCAPAGAEPIPAASPYAVTRLELRVAVAGPTGDLAASAAEAVRRMVYA